MQQQRKNNNSYDNYIIHKWKYQAKEQQQTNTWQQRKSKNIMTMTSFANNKQWEVIETAATKSKNNNNDHSNYNIYHHHHQLQFL